MIPQTLPKVTLRDFYKRFYPYIKDYFLLFFLVVLTSGITAAGQAGSAYLIKPALDDIFLNKDTYMLKLVPFLVVLAYFAKGAGSYAQGFLITYIGSDIVRRIREDVLEHVLKLDLQFFNKMRTGELLSRVTGDIEMVRAAVTNYCTDLVREAFTILALIIVVIYQSPMLAFYSFVVLPFSVVPVLILMRHVKRLTRKGVNKGADITSKLTEVLSSAEIIKANNGEQLELEHYKKENKILFKLGIKGALIGGINSPLMELLGAIAIGIVIFVGGNEVIQGRMTVGEFGAFTAALFMLWTPIKRLVGIFMGFQSALVAGERIAYIMDLQPTIIDGKKTLQKPIESIKVENAKLRYDEVVALNGVSIQIARNEIIALVGKSGSGKSSLVNMILRLYDPSEGRILINGEDLQDFTQKSVRDNISIVTQRIFIFNDTIAANVAYGSKINKERVIDALKKAQMLDFVQSMENGIDSKLDEFGTNLSGGQRQRIAIARAIYKNSDVLIFDEATSALDIKTEEEIRKTIESIKKDKLIILIAHRPSTISLAHRIYHLENGLITHINTPEEFFRDEKLREMLEKEQESNEAKS
ncbi:ABC transporter ATP-binding protein [Helicobacter sp. T3_23-1059]